MSSKRFVIPSLAALLLLLVYADARGQATTGQLEGHVVDANGSPVAFASVMVSSPVLQGGRGAQTDDKGDFVMLALAVGDYTVRLHHLAYRTREFAEVHVRLGQTTTLGVVRLESQVHELSEILVSGQPRLVDPRTTVLGANLSARDFESLPIDRDFKTVATLLPHANASSLGDATNFAGATGLENRYFVDGVEVSDPYRGATATRLPYNIVQEVQVRTGGYDAEFRSSLGGAVNAITYSGGNVVTGQVFGFLTNNSFSSTPRSVPGRSGADQRFALYDYGFGVGGPIRKDRLWYYAAYNPSTTTEDVVIPGWRTYVDRAKTQSFAAKLTWRANDRNTIVLTSLGDPTEGRQVLPPAVAPAAVDPFLFNIRQGGVATVLEGRHMLRDDILLRTMLSYSTRIEESLPETETGRSAPFFADSAGTISGGGARSSNRSAVSMATVHATWINGTQQVKAGLEYRGNRLNFDNLNTIVIQSPGSLYYYQTSLFKGHVGSRLPSGFVQHTWRPGQRWQVTDGVRWDGQYWMTSENKVGQTILDQWQPRIGVTYEPGNLGSQKVYASFGRFYEDLTTAPLFWYYNLGSLYYSANFTHDPRTDTSGADTLAYAGGAIQPRLQGLQGQFSDEVTAGYERELGPRARLALRGVVRILRQGIEDGFDLATFSVGISNPGIGALKASPPMTRRYSALEVSFQGGVGRDLSVLASYVLSRNFGNYEGLYDSQYNNPFPNATALYDVPDELLNATGLLPNDHTHVLKLAGSYHASQQLTLGLSGFVASGSPVSEIGGTPVGPPYGAFIGARGSHGRMPATWDLNLRVSYAQPLPARDYFRPKFTVDVLHVASQRKAVRFDQVHWRQLDSLGNEIDPNPSWGIPTAFQPPMAVRVGMEVGW